MKIYNQSDIKIHYRMIQHRDWQGMRNKRGGHIEPGDSKTIQRPSFDHAWKVNNNRWLMANLEVVIFENEDYANKFEHDVNKQYWKTVFSKAINIGMSNFPPIDPMYALVEVAENVMSNLAVSMVTTFTQTTAARTNSFQPNPQRDGKHKIIGSQLCGIWGETMKDDYADWDEWRVYFWDKKQPMDGLYKNGDVGLMDLKEMSVDERRKLYNLPYQGEDGGKVSMGVYLYKGPDFTHYSKQAQRYLSVDSSKGVEARTGKSNRVIWRMRMMEDNWGAFSLQNTKSEEYVKVRDDGVHLVAKAKEIEDLSESDRTRFRFYPTYTSGFFIGDNRDAILTGYIGMDSEFSKTKVPHVISSSFDYHHVRLLEAGTKDTFQEFTVTPE